VNETERQHPRTWVLWVVRAALALTVLGIGIGRISSIWVKTPGGPSLWLVFAVPQVSIALLALLICWAASSRPVGLELNVGFLLLYGMVAALIYFRWIPIIIGALAILALFLRPRGKPFIEASPPPAGWPRP
jgi:hypothetical protein